MVSSRHEVLPDIEWKAVWAKIPLCKNFHLLVGICYRSPNAWDEESVNLWKLIENAAKSCVIIFWDVNYPNINWEKLDADSANNILLDKVTDLFLTQHVKQPTRGPNILDLVFTTEPEMINDIKVREHLANCDHNILTCELGCDATRRLNSNKLNYIFHKGIMKSSEVAWPTSHGRKCCLIVTVYNRGRFLKLSYKKV